MLLMYQALLSLRQPVIKLGLRLHLLNANRINLIAQIADLLDQPFMA